MKVLGTVVLILGCVSCTDGTDLSSGPGKVYQIEVTFDVHYAMFLSRLERIGYSHKELYDTDVREQLSTALDRTFISPEPGYQIPKQYGLFSKDGNESTYEAISEFLRHAAYYATNDPSLSTAAARLQAIQNENIKTGGEGLTYDEFLGHRDSL